MSNLNLLALKKTQSSLDFNSQQIQKTLHLLIEDSCTIPFIARYRKEATGGLEDVDIIKIMETYQKSVELESRRSFILENLKKLEKLSPALELKVKSAESLNQLEDLYAPFKTKVKTKAQIAIEAGLKPLAEILKTSPKNISEIEKLYSKDFINKEKKIESFEQALAGAMAILSEEAVHNSDLREVLRNDYWKSATIKSEKHKEAEKNPQHLKYKDYFEFEQKISELKEPRNSYRYLALRRGNLEKTLKVDVYYDKLQAVNTISKSLYPNLDKLGCKDLILKSLQRAYSVSIHTSLSLEIKSDLKKLSDTAAIDVFGVNLKNLLLQPYLGQKAVLGIDPGVRTGCKVVVIDKNGNFLVDTVIYPHPPKNDKTGAVLTLKKLIEDLKIEYIAVGNGTYGKETLSLIQKEIELVKSGKVKALLVNEDGASIYSASEVAREEFPDKDVTVRGAVSIARRFQDPLGELVKIDPKSIGVGQYQHDVNQVQLKKSLQNVVEGCVNYVGVDLNTASAPLLSYVSGIGPGLAKNIVKKREAKKGFKSRQDLLEVSRFTDKTFEQSAGFLRVYESSNPLDQTFIHPEQYPILETWCKEKSISMNDFISKKEMIENFKKDKITQEKIGRFTHEDIVKSLLAPSQDPRTEFKAFEFRKDLESISDLKVGQHYPGLVTNITQFGAFVDIGLKENGLIHISQMSDSFVDDPLKVLKVGQEVTARLIDLDLERKRIALSLKSESGTSRMGKSNKKPKQQKSSQQKRKDFKASENPFAALKNLKL